MKQIIFLAFVAFVPMVSAADDVVYLKAAALIDTQNGATISNPVVEISGDRVVAVTSGGEVPEGANIIDLGDATILPGLADTHTHLTFDAGDFGYGSLAISETDEVIRGVANARITLMAGFTSARNLGAQGYSDVSLRDGINAGRVPGPRLQVSGPAMSATGGHCDNNLLPNEYDHEAEGVANGPWEVRAKVREIRKYGADLIKICATGGVLSKGTNPGARQYSMEELQAIVDEAHMLGMPVAAHAHGTEGILFAIRAGVDAIEHASLMDAESIKLAKRNGTFASINAYTPRYMLATGLANGILPESLEKARKLAVNRYETYSNLISEGVKVSFGSDSATIPHGDNAKQFAIYVELGMTPMQAIQSATTVAAESFGWVGDIGAVAPGFYADIIAVDGDPLEDITLLEKVAFVMKGGEVYKSPK